MPFTVEKIQRVLKNPDIWYLIWNQLDIYVTENVENDCSEELGEIISSYEEDRFKGRELFDFIGQISIIELGKPAVFLWESELEACKTIFKICGIEYEEVPERYGNGNFAGYTQIKAEPGVLERIRDYDVQVV